MWNLRVSSKAYEAIESLTFHRAIALLRTDRDHEQKSCAHSFILHCSWSRSSRIWVFLDILKISMVSELNSPCSALCTEAPEYTINMRSSVSLAPSQENNTQFNVRLELAYFLAKFHATLLQQSACLWGFLRWLFLRTGRARISLMRFTFLDTASRLPFFFPEFSFVPDASQEFQHLFPDL